MFLKGLSQAAFLRHLRHTYDCQDPINYLFNTPSNIEVHPLVGSFCSITVSDNNKDGCGRKKKLG